MAILMRGSPFVFVQIWEIPGMSVRLGMVLIVVVIGVIIMDEKSNFL
jgi:hypothetical protein